MKIIVLGASGNIGSEIVKSMPASWNVVSAQYRGGRYCAIETLHVFGGWRRNGPHQKLEAELLLWFRFTGETRLALGVGKNWKFCGVATPGEYHIPT